MTDVGWHRVFDSLRDRDVAPSEISAALNGAVSARDITDWKRGAKRPPLHLLPQLSVVLGERTTYLAELLGTVPSADAATIGIETAVRELDLLRQRIARSRGEVESQAAESVARIASTAVTSGRWAVAIWPAIAGPPNCRIHVSDRIDFQRVDGTPVTDDQVAAEFGGLLAEAGAVRSTNVPRWADPSSAQTSSWSLVRYAFEFPPQPMWFSQPSLSISVVGLSENVQTRTIAATIARAVGYGHRASSLTTTFNDGPLTKDDPENESRLRTHQAWQVAPMPRYVNSHFGLPRLDAPGDGADTVADSAYAWLGDVRPGRFTVWVRESDEMAKTSSAATRHWREHLDAITSKRSDVVVINHGASRSKVADRDERVQIALEVAEEAIEVSLHRGLLHWTSIASALRSHADSQSRSWAVSEYVLGRLLERDSSRSAPTTTRHSVPSR